MDNFDFKDLKLIRKKEILVDNKCAELDKLNELLIKVRISSFDEKVQNSNNNSSIEDIIQRIDEQQEEVNKAVDDFIAFRKLCIQKVNELENNNLIDLAYKRYFEYKKFEQIAEEMNLSLRWVLKLNSILLSGNREKID